MGIPSFRRTAPKIKICDNYTSFKETCLFTSFFHFQTFLNDFFYILARKFFFSLGVFFFAYKRVFRGRMGVVLLPWQRGKPLGARTLGATLFAIKKQKFLLYYAAKREALSSGVLGGTT